MASTIHQSLPLTMAVRLMCAPTMEEEHAVSTAREGPLRPNTNDMRPAAGANVGMESND